MRYPKTNVKALSFKKNTPDVSIKILKDRIQRRHEDSYE
jgi:hypothetical protein